MSALRKVAPLLLAIRAFAQTPVLTVAAPSRFQQGDLIPFTLHSSQPPGFDRRYRLDGFLLTPPGADCGSLSRPCFRGGAFNGPAALHDIEEGELNGYLPPLKPGPYRVAALETLLLHRPSELFYRDAQPRQYVRSNEAEFDIIPADPDWQRRVIGDAVSILNGQPPAGTEKAVRRLQYLQIPAAWEAALDRFERDPNRLAGVLREANDQKAVCALMQPRLTRPGQFVDASYLYTLSDACSRSLRPPMPKVDFEKPEGQKAYRQWTQQIEATRAPLYDRAAVALAAHLNEKTPAGKTAAVEALVGAVARHPDALPSWLPQVRREVIGEWPQLTTDQRRSFLGWAWPVLRGPQMLPVVEALANRTLEQSGDLQTWRLAIKRLHDLDPSRAQVLIVEDMLQPASRVDDATLSLLSPAAIVDVAPRLIDTVIAAATSPRGNAPLAKELLARYGDAASLPRVRALYASHEGQCQPELLAYLLRIDPAYAATLLPPPPSDVHQPEPPCTQQYFQITARLYIAPTLEKFIAAFLMYGTIPSKTQAAETLGRYGTPAALAPLWEAFRYYHDWWKDRRGELSKYQEGARLEVALRNAIARGMGWLATETDIRALADLCLNPWCTSETTNDLRAVQPKPGMSVSENSANLAQYSELRYPDQLERKLAQYPAGTVFRLRAEGAARAAIVARLREFGASHQFTFEPIEPIE